jgi:hypothetical protein
MSVTVNLCVFSGRENPTWELSKDQVDILRNKLSALQSTSLEKAAGLLGGLGYQGFGISADREMDLEPRIFVHQNVVDLGSANVSLRDQGGDLERWLLSTAADDVVEPRVRGYVETQLPPATAYAGRAAPARARAFEVPRYEPNAWNSDLQILENNNCYNYANNKVTNTFAQPGRGSGQESTTLTGREVAAAAVRDGLEGLAASDAPQMTPVEGHFAALVIWPGTDYHWYRLDDTTQWSHKPGQTPVRDHDNSGRPITDPKACDRGPYTQFVGFFQTFPNHVAVR